MIDIYFLYIDNTHTYFILYYIHNLQSCISHDIWNKQTETETETELFLNFLEV